jgi:hypothetical protein
MEYSTSFPGHVIFLQKKLIFPQKFLLTGEFCLEIWRSG